MSHNFGYWIFITATFSLLLSNIACAEDADILEQIPDSRDELNSYTTEEKISLLEKANTVDATKYESIYMPSDFWHFSYDKIPDVNNIDVSSLARKSLLENNFNGSFSGLSYGPAVSDYFKTIIEAYSRTCRDTLGPNVSPLTITTTKKTTDLTYGGSYTQTLGKHTVYVRPRYAKTYQEAFNRKTLGVYNGIDIIRDIKHLMKIEGCDSKINSQLIENLYRTINGMQSLQQDRRDNIEYKSKRPDEGDAGRSSTFLFYHYDESRPGHIEYVFANPTSNFVPPSPVRLLEITFKKFGKENFNKKLRRNFSWKPMLTINNVSTGQLKKITVSYMLATTSPTLLRFKYLAMGFSNWDPTLENNEALSNKVYSHFAKLDEKQKHRVVECLYEGGGYLVYWLDTKPEGAEPEELRRFYKYHPLLVVQEKRDSCPTTLHEGNWGKDYIYNGLRADANSQKTSSPVQKSKSKAIVSTPLIEKHKTSTPKRQPKTPTPKQQPKTSTPKQQSIKKVTPVNKPNKSSIKEYYKEIERLTQDKTKAIVNCDNVEDLDARGACLKKVCTDMETLASTDHASDALKATAKTCKGEIYYKLRKIESSR